VIKQFPLPMHDFRTEGGRCRPRSSNRGSCWRCTASFLQIRETERCLKWRDPPGKLSLDMTKFSEDQKDPAIASQIDGDIESMPSQPAFPGTPAITSRKLLNQRSSLVSSRPSTTD